MELKERVLEAALEEFNEKGMKFTMDDVSRRLSISKRTLYLVVKDKEDLFKTSIDYVYAKIKEEERKIADDSSLGTLEKLEKLLIAMPPEYQSLDFRKIAEIQSRYPLLYKRIEENIESQWETTIALIHQAEQEGLIREVNIPVFKTMFSATIEYYLTRSVLKEANMSYEEGLKDMLDLLMNGIIVK